MLGYMEFLWAVAYENGNPVIGDADDIEAAAEFPGERGKLTEALACGTGGAGLIEECPDRPGCFEIRDLYDHAPRTKNAWSGQSQHKAKGKSIQTYAAKPPRLDGMQTVATGMQTDANENHLHPARMRTGRSSRSRTRPQEERDQLGRWPRLPHRFLECH